MAAGGTQERFPASPRCLPAPGRKEMLVPLPMTSPLGEEQLTEATLSFPPNPPVLFFIRKVSASKSLRLTPLPQTAFSSKNKINSVQSHLCLCQKLFKRKLFIVDEVLR